MLIGYFYNVQFNKKMDNTTAINLSETELIKIQVAEKIYNRKQSFVTPPVINPVREKLLAEGGDNFLNYLERRGFMQESDLLVLSSKHHFYYDQNDLADVRVLVNIKKLNYIKHLDSFLHVIFRILPSDARFIGCFTDSKNGKTNGSPFHHTKIFYKKFIDFLDARTDRRMTRNEVEEILDSHGFKIVDMTELNGLTYFTTLNQRTSGE